MHDSILLVVGMHEVKPSGCHGRSWHPDMFISLCSLHIMLSLVWIRIVVDRIFLLLRPRLLLVKRIHSWRWIRAVSPFDLLIGQVNIRSLPGIYYSIIVSIRRRSFILVVMLMLLWSKLMGHWLPLTSISRKTFGLTGTHWGCSNLIVF